MIKYILDTSVIVSNPSIFEAYSDCELIIPIIVLEELDHLKHQTGDKARNSRIAIKKLNELSKTTTDINDGIDLGNNSKLFIDGKSYKTPIGEEKTNDLRILACAKAHSKKKGDEVIVLSNDINMQVRARSLNIKAESHDTMKTNLEELYSGVQYIYNDDMLADIYEHNNVINPEKYNIELLENEYAVFDNCDNQSAIGKLDSSGMIHLLNVNAKQSCWIEAQNVEQYCALDALFNKEIPLVSLIGTAGSGKSLLAIAASVDMVIDRHLYEKIVVYKSIVPVGNDIGFLPGPQPLTAKIATPNGWTTMGELSVGDLVIGRDGKPTKVLEIFPKGKKEVFKISTTDGTSTECCEDHLWLTSTFEDLKRGKSGSIKTTKQIMNSMVGYRGAINHYLPRNEAIEYTKKELLLEPYTLGVLLGDGCLTRDSLNLSSADIEIVDRINLEVNKFDCELVPSQEYQYTITSKTNKLESGNKYRNLVKEYIYRLGLLGKKAWEKHIPKEYLTSSIDDRLNILRGLMDTDGTVKKNGETSFTTTSLQLANDLTDLVRSLGGRAIIRSRNRIGKVSKFGDHTATSQRISYEFNIRLPNDLNPFFIQRKASRYSCKQMMRIGIESIKSTGRFEEVQCIMVENKEHLYITDDFIVTHNSMKEKLEHWFGSIYDSFEFLLSSKSRDKSSKNGKKEIRDLDKPVRSNWKEQLDMWEKDGKLQFEAMTYIRGRNIDNAVIIFDEAQNLTREEIKTLLTRVGKNSKIILTGDIEQIDNFKLDAMNNGLTYVVEQFKGNTISTHITLKECERSVLAEVASKIL